MLATSGSQPSVGSEDGGVLVMVTIWLPIIILFITLVVDVGNWFEHKRHLQSQADASALAAAGDFRIPCADQTIIDRASQYAGFTSPSGTTYNVQVAAGQARTHILTNSATYYNQSSPTDTTVRTGPPCSAGMIDVKLTETDLPWYFGFGKVVSFINAHARVEIKPMVSAAQALPVGVPDVNPVSGRVWLINENDGSTIASRPLLPNGTANGLAIWDNATNALANVTMPSAPVGVRVALSGDPASTTCGDPLVACFDLTDSLHGISFIRTWSDSGAYPRVRDAFLTAGSCSNGYLNAGACAVGITADINIGPNSTTGLTIAANYTGALNGAGSTVTTLTNTGAACAVPVAGCTRWTGVGTVPISAASGPVNIHLRWNKANGSTWDYGTGAGSQACQGNTKCESDLGVIQRSFSYVDTRSGPIRALEVLEGGVSGANSFLSGSQHSLVVRIGVQGSLQYASSVSDPPVYLRVNGSANGNNNQSQNQSLDCDPASGTALWYEMAHGCAPSYTINSGTACPASPNTLWGSAQPWPCVALQTGAAVNDPARGLNLRILGNSSANSCPAAGQRGHNNWSMAFDPNYNLAGDPRLVDVFLTPFGSFNGSGNGTVPVTQFATFYVTGWTAQGGGFNNPCQGNGDDPVPNGDPGIIVGHFIKYVQILNNGGGGSGFCNLSVGGGLNSGACIAVLTQ